MSISQKWTKEELMSLYQMKKEGKSDKEIADALKKTLGAISRKYVRTEWDEFIEDPENYLAGNALRKWTHSEMCQLFAYLQSKQSYNFIADKLNRSPVSVERKAQSTDWAAWELASGQNSQPLNVETETLAEQLSDALVVFSRHDPERLKGISKSEFYKQINFDNEEFPVAFDELKRMAYSKLEKIGLGNPELIQLGEGTYIVVGDSHGKHTKTAMFQLVKHLEAHINPKSIIHVGHILDDDNTISYNWSLFKNLIVIAKKEELQLVQEQRNAHGFSYNIARGGVQIGEDLLVTNQDLINDYSKTSISSIDQEIVDNKVIINCHRLEYASKTSEEDFSYYASPGCLCEPHIIKTIKQIDFSDNKIIKQAYPDGFSKYRRMQHMNKFWRYGCIVVNVNKEGVHTIVPCPIVKIGKEYATSYLDKIVTSKGVKEPSKKIFVTSDAHSPNHDSNVLDIQEQICAMYKPDILVNGGDAHDYKSLNHHDIEKGRVIFEDLLKESATVHHVLKRMRGWAPEAHIIIGNHERFGMDFIAKFPQLSSYLDFNFMCDIESLGYKRTELKNSLHIEGTKFIHGDLKMFGQNGNKLEKSSRTFGNNVFIGHIHHSGIRFGCFSLGCACNLDQGYNEPSASNWVHGFGMCNHYAGHSFPTVISIMNNTCVLDRTYVPQNPENWDVKSYKARIVYDTE